MMKNVGTFGHAKTIKYFVGTSVLFKICLMLVITQHFQKVNMLVVCYLHIARLLIFNIKFISLSYNNLK